VGDCGVNVLLLVALVRCGWEDADLVLNGFISTSRREVLRHLVLCSVGCGGDGGWRKRRSQMAMGSQLVELMPRHVDTVS
jgi:hypothetical protein